MLEGIPSWSTDEASKSGLQRKKKRKGWQRGPTMPCSFIDSACSLGTKMDLSKISKTLTHPIRSLSLNVLTKNRTAIRCTCGHLCCRHSLPGQHFRSTPATATTLDTASSQSQCGCNVGTLLCGNTQAGNSTVIVQYINFIQLSSPQTASIGSGIQYRKIGCCTFGTSPSLKDVNIAGHVTNRLQSICAYCWEVECWACRLKAASAWCTASLQNITRYLSSAIRQYGILSLFLLKRASYVWTLGLSKYVFRCDFWKENLRDLMSWKANISIYAASFHVWRPVKWELRIIQKSQATMREMAGPPE